jgi:hypothetical protein
VTRPDDFHTCAAELERNGVPGCTTSIYRHDVWAEVVAAVRRLVRSEGASHPSPPRRVLAPSVPIGANEQEDNDMGLFSNKPQPGPGVASANARAKASAGHHKAADKARMRGDYMVAGHHEQQANRMWNEQRKLNQKGR